MVLPAAVFLGGACRAEFTSTTASRGREHLVDFKRSEEIYLVICDERCKSAPALAHTFPRRSRVFTISNAKTSEPGEKVQGTFARGCRYFGKISYNLNRFCKNRKYLLKLERSE